MRSAFQEPSVVTKPHHMSQPLSKNSDRVRKTLKAHKAVEVWSWVEPSVKASLQEIAGEQGLSLSATIAELLKTAISESLHKRHATLIIPTIRKAIGKEHQKD